MRRGLIAWSRAEAPDAALDARVARLQEAMRAEDLDAALVYSSFPRPAAVAWLTHFVPYWNEALLVAFPDGAPLFLAAFSKRVHPWIREVSHVGEVRSASDLGISAAEILRQRLAQSRAARVGVVELDALPWRVAEPIARQMPAGALVDATALFAAIRQPADAVEVALARRASAIAANAFAAIPQDARRASEVLAAAERRARLDGAEDLIQRLAPDLASDATLRRFENDAPLGERYALELTLAYKAVTTRASRCFARGARPPSWEQAERWFAQAAARARTDRAPKDTPGSVRTWRLEACLGGEPLRIIADNGEPPRYALPNGALATLAVRLELEDGAWYGAAPIVAGSGPVR
jgi:Xaa-Pro aminopeptidase